MHAHRVQGRDLRRPCERGPGLAKRRPDGAPIQPEEALHGLLHMGERLRPARGIADLEPRLLESAGAPSELGPQGRVLRCPLRVRAGEDEGERERCVQ